MQQFENGILGSFEGIKIETDGSGYNYSQLNFKFNPENQEYNPRLDLMFTE